MSQSRCDQLDEYLCGWLTSEAAAEFEAHLSDCPACQEECSLQRRIDRLLGEGFAIVNPVPASVAGRIERGIRTARRRRIGWSIAVTAAAAGIVAALGIWANSNGLMPTAIDQQVAESPNDNPLGLLLKASTQPQAAAGSTRVTLVDPSSAILVPIESHSPNVTIVRIYPTTKVAADDARNPSP